MVDVDDNYQEEETIRSAAAAAVDEEQEAMHVPELEASSQQVDGVLTEDDLGSGDEEVQQSNQESDDDGDDEDEDEEEEELTKEELLSKRRACYIKVFVGLLLVGFVVFVVVDALTAGHVKDGIDTFLEWIEENPVAGMFVFILVYFGATVLFIPGSLLTLGAGFVFAAAFGLGGGIVLGTISVFVGASMGAIASFLLGRYLLRDVAQKLTKKYTIFEALDAALEENGLKIFVLLRLSPIIPFNIINYIGGVSSVSFRDYVLALFAILPGTVLYIFLGASAGSLTDSASSGGDATVIIIVVGAVLGIAAIWLSARYAKKELRRIIEERETDATNSDINNEGQEQAESGNELVLVEAEEASTSQVDNV